MLDPNIHTKTNLSGRTHRIGNKKTQPKVSCTTKHDWPILSFPIRVLVLLMRFPCPHRVLPGRPASKGLRKKTIWGEGAKEDGVEGERKR